jgi:WD40 repeat protein
VAFTPDGTALGIGLAAERTLRIHDLATGRCEMEFGPFQGVLDLAFSPDGRTVLAGSGQHAHLCDRATGNYRSLPHDTAVVATAYHPAGHTFVTGTVSGQLRWWDAATLECLAVTPAHAERIQRAAYSAGGELVATVGWDDRLCFWHSRTRKRIDPPVRLTGGGNAVAFHPGGRMVAVACKDGRICFAPVPRALSGTPRRLLRQVQVATGLELDPDGTPRPLDAAAWRQRQQELAAEGGPPW